MPDKLGRFPSFLLAGRYYSRIFITMQPMTTSGDFLCISDIIWTLLNVSLLSNHLPLRIAQTSVADPDYFYPDPDPALHFATDPDPAFNFDTDLDPSCFEEAMYLKRYGTFYTYVLIWFSLSAGPPGPNQKVYFVKFSCPVHFVVLIRVGIDLYTDPRHPGTDPDPRKWYWSERMRILNTCQNGIQYSMSISKVSKTL
jgi:hypothetical protein